MAGAMAVSSKSDWRVLMRFAEPYMFALIIMSATECRTELWRALQLGSDQRDDPQETEMDAVVQQTDPEQVRQTVASVFSLGYRTATLR